MKTIVDIHNHLDLLPGFIRLFNNKVYKHSNDPNYLLDQARSRNNRVIISVAIYVSPLLAPPLKQVEEQVRHLQKFVNTNDDVMFIKSADDLDKDFSMGLLLHLESARWLNGDLKKLNQLYDLGVRGIIPVHFVTSWFGGSGEDPRQADGITDSAKNFLHEMHRLGMWMDVSHMDEKTCKQSLEHYPGPVMASHIGLKEFRPPKRNISIQNAKTMFSKGGCYGLIAWTHLMGKTEAEFKQQIDYLIQEGHQDHLTIGTDLGAPIKTPSFIKNLFDYADFLEKNYPQLADKILAENAISFFKKALN